MAKTENVSAKVNTRPDVVATTPYSFPESLDEAKKMWGEDVCLSRLNANVTIFVQGGMRGVLAKGGTAEEAAAHGAKMVPGVQAQRFGVDPEQAFLAKFRAADPEEKKRMLAMLKAG